MLALSGCLTTEPFEPVPQPPARPQSLAPAQPAAPAVAAPSEKSQSLSRYYGRLQERRLTQGLLRTDGGGIDTPFTAAMLERNFARIAFYDEYVRGGGLTVSTDGPGRLKRWGTPIRMTVEFGDKVPQANQAKDTAEVRKYADRLARITGHPITMTASDPNFHVLFMSHDDGPQLYNRIKEIVPNINPKALAIFDELPRYVQCLVIAFSAEPGGYDYAQSIAVIRSEHPDLIRKSCIHEEIAQGMGLANDSPRARPSIFNDDDEFALLTTHDEILLEVLYDPALRPGMSLSEARPIFTRIIAQKMGGES